MATEATASLGTGHTDANVFVTQRAKVANVSGGQTSSTGEGIREALARKRGEVDDEDGRLEERKRAVRERQERCREAELRLKARAAETAERRLQAEKAGEECRQKLARVEARATEERAIAESLDKECKEKEAELERLAKVRQETIAAVESLAWIQRFLQRVTESSDEFPTIAEVLNRHATLVRAHGVSEAQQRRQKDEVNALQAEIAGLSKKHREEMLLGESLLAAKKKELEEERQRTDELAEHVQSESTVFVERLRVQGELLMSVRNLCTRIDERHSADDPIDVVLTRFTRVGERLGDLHDIVVGFEEEQQQSGNTATQQQSTALQ